MNTDILILRQTDYAALVNNGAPLTNDEQDGNLVNIYKDFEALAVTTSVAAYNAGTTYNDDDNQFATYGGRLWQWINTTPGSGQTPVDGIYWVEVFPTILAHRRNSDTILDEGGANEISAAAIVAGLAAADATTDLGISTHTGYTFLLTSSTGADITIPEATEELSGLLNKDDKAVLNMTSGQNTGDQTLGSLGAEDVNNKATDFSTLNDQLYPSVQAVETRISAETSSIVGAATSAADTLEKIENVLDSFGATLTTVIVDIGDWNMDASGSVSVAHGIADYSKIRTVDVMIIPDAATTLIPLVIGSSPAGATAGYIGQITSTNIILFRVAGASFDSVDYDSTSFNRGYITIQYVL